MPPRSPSLTRRYVLSQRGRDSYRERVGGAAVRVHTPSRVPHPWAASSCREAAAPLTNSGADTRGSETGATIPQVLTYDVDAMREVVAVLRPLLGGSEQTAATIMETPLLLAAATAATAATLVEWLGEPAAGGVVRLHPQILTLGRKHVRNVRNVMEYVLEGAVEARSLAAMRCAACLTPASEAQAPPVKYTHSDV
jgi:hypothetical protein